MEDVLRWSLLVLGSCVIAGVLAHGLWVSRKNSNKSLDNSINAKHGPGKREYQGGGRDDESEDQEQANNTLIDMEQDSATEHQPGVFAANISEKNESPQASKFDELGLGAARVIPTGVDELEPSTTPEQLRAVDEQQETPSTKAVSMVDEPKMYASVVTQPKPGYSPAYPRSGQNQSTSALKGNQSNNYSRLLADSDMPEPPASLLRKTSSGETPDIEKLEQTAGQMAEKDSLADQAINLVKRKRSEKNGAKRKEPKFADDQLRIDFEQEQGQQNAAQDEAIEKQQAAGPVEIKQEVLVLNVKVPEGTPVPGSALLPMLLTLGLKFGDQDIFHRHVNSNGKGPVLFSLANMFKPGNFDIDSLENFTTQGVSLFMILPIEGDPHQVFNMMHNAARKIADEFDAQILDGRRSLLTKQSLQQYVEKIREFERQRAIHGK
jgi:cell division protein ZipA